MDSLRIKNGSGCIETDDDKYSEADDDTDQDDFDESLSVWDSSCLILPDILIFTGELRTDQFKVSLLSCRTENASLDSPIKYSHFANSKNT